MKKKIVFLSILILITCGCNCEYNITISDGKVNEELIINQLINSTYDREYLDGRFEEEYPINYNDFYAYYEPSQKIDGYTYYNKQKKIDEYNYKFDYTATFNLQKYDNSRIANESFKTVSYNYNSEKKCNELIMSNFTIKKNNPDIESVVAKVYLDGYDAIYNNADSVIGDTFIWNLNDNDNVSLCIKKNSNKNDIKKEEEKDVNNSTVVEDEEETNIMLVFFILAGFFMVLAFIIKFSNIKKQ